MIVRTHHKVLAALTMLGSVAWAQSQIPVCQESKNSALDKFISDLGGSIPFPPQMILQTLAAKGHDFVGSVIPHGRSAERKFTDYAKPRSLIAYHPDPSRPSEIVLVAYTPGNSQLQIISTNRRTLGYDFSIVEHYAAGQKPVVQFPLRGLCLPCHQSGGPIFPRFAWSETTSNEEIKKKVLHPPGGGLPDPFAHLIVSNGEWPAGSGLKGRIKDSASEYEGFSIKGGFSMFSRQFCVTGCGLDRNCQKGVILESTMNALSDSNDAAKMREWIHHSHLYWEAARGLDLSTLLRSDSQLLDRKVLPGQELSIKPEVGVDPLLPRRKAELNSPTPELREGLMMNHFGNCLEFSDEQRRKLEEAGPNAILRLENSQVTESLLDNWPVSEISVLQAVRTGALDQEGRCRGAAADLSLRKLFEGVDPAGRNRTSISSGQNIAAAQMLFSQYCAGCQLGARAPAPRLPLEHLDTPEGLAALRDYHGTANRTVDQMLRAPEVLMPPSTFPQPSFLEREVMIRALKRNP